MVLARCGRTSLSPSIRAGALPDLHGRSTWSSRLESYRCRTCTRARLQDAPARTPEAMVAAAWRSLYAPTAVCLRAARISVSASSGRGPLCSRTQARAPASVARLCRTWVLPFRRLLLTFRRTVQSRRLASSASGRLARSRRTLRADLRVGEP